MTTYSMAVGDLDATRLALIDRFYSPSSRAFRESGGIGKGDDPKVAVELFPTTQYLARLIRSDD